MLLYEGTLRHSDIRRVLVVANIFLFAMLLQAASDFTFANQAGVDMLETTLVALQDISLEKIFDDHGRKNICSEFPQIMNQVSNQTLATNDALFLDTENLKNMF